MTDIFPVAKSPSPRDHLLMVGMLRFVFDINQPSLSTTVHSVLVSFFCLYGPLNYISFHAFSRQLYVLSLCSSGLISASLVLSAIHLCMKVSFRPDIIPGGWLGSKHQLTNCEILSCLRHKMWGSGKHSSKFTTVVLAMQSCQFINISKSSSFPSDNVLQDWTQLKFSLTPTAWTSCQIQPSLTSSSTLL